ncbi:hypothetical protein [uncultured Ferrimonas sp.]|uniref:hypothetical protein n=1 Tax=uncultured Ferrimonas sp. TaxID=432640 RepID=UPI002605DF2C|nr:hypothetical protein [uncultured Ferrimonas sp.]
MSQCEPTQMFDVNTRLIEALHQRQLNRNSSLVFQPLEALWCADITQQAQQEGSLSYQTVRRLAKCYAVPLSVLLAS